MKTIIISTFIILFSLLLYGQNRLDSWPVEDFTSVQIDTQLNDMESKNFSSDNPKIIRMVYDYLHRIKLQAFNNSENMVLKESKDWHFRIQFNNWQDEYWIYNSAALVGKSSYTIKSDISEKFSGFYKRLLSIK